MKTSKPVLVNTVVFVYQQAHATVGQKASITNRGLYVWVVAREGKVVGEA